MDGGPEIRIASRSRAVSPRCQATWVRRCATSTAERRGLERTYLPGSRNMASAQGLPRNLGWSLDALSGDRNDTARETEAGSGVERSERAIGAMTWGNLLTGNPAERRSAPKNKLVGGKR
jgi:hypothetical protein